MEHGRRLKMTLYLEPDLARAVDQDARKRHLPTTRAAADAIRRALVDEQAEGLADTVKMRLDRLEKREVIRAREMAIIKEAILLYVRVWLFDAAELRLGDKKPVIVRIERRVRLGDQQQALQASNAQRRGEESSAFDAAGKGESGKSSAKRRADR